MKKNRAEKVIVHMPEGREKEAKRRLRASELTALEKVEEIDQILECRKGRKV